MRDFVNDVDTGIPITWNGTPGREKNIKWSAQLGSKAYGGPIISGGHIYVGTNNFVPREPEIKGDKGVLMCFNEADGKFLWQSVHDKLLAGRVNDWEFEGIASSPFVEGDRLWYVSNRCELLCASTNGLAAGNRGVTDEKYNSKADADVIWRLDMMKYLGVFPHNLSACSPLVIGDTVFVTTGNGVDEGHKNVPNPNAPSFIAVDKNTGAVKWTNNDPGSHIMHGQWSSPAYAEPNGKPMVIFAGGDGWIRAFNPADGALIWKFDGNPKKSFYTLGPEGTRSDFLATPVIYKDKLYIATGQDPEHGKGVGHLWCVDITKEPKNKDKDLSPVNDNFDPKAPENKDSALVWHYGGNAPADFDRAFYFGRSMSTCCVRDGLVYAAEFRWNSPLSRRRYGQSLLGTRPARRHLEFAALRRWQDLPGRRPRQDFDIQSGQGREDVGRGPDRAQLQRAWDAGGLQRHALFHNGKPLQAVGGRDEISTLARRASEGFDRLPDLRVGLTGPIYFLGVIG